MRLSSQSSQFIFNLPGDFLKPETINTYQPILEKNWVQYENVIDYLNSTIKQVNFPGISFDMPKQILMRGKERQFKPAKNVQVQAQDHTCAIQVRLRSCMLNAGCGTGMRLHTSPTVVVRAALPLPPLAQLAQRRADALID